ncbi:MAG: hypothetical protein ABFS05_00060 [Bacteroidota bacterium]
MRWLPINISIIFMILSGIVFGQMRIDCDGLEMEAGSDFISKGKYASSVRTWHSDSLSDASIVLCPAGLHRSSQDDIKKRYSFDWTVKYNNIYLKTKEGLIIEGLNEHGFSASLMFLNNSQLAGKEKEHIPIAASLVINFFIDHFKCVDTALLAVWDVRIYDDLGMTCGWPFRIVLHDSAGSTAYIEHIDGHKRVYTPGSPALIVDGPDYARLITIKYLQDSIPGNKAEMRYLQIQKEIDSDSFDGMIFYYIKNHPEIPFLEITRGHSRNAQLLILKRTDAICFEIQKLEFKTGVETILKVF